MSFLFCDFFVTGMRNTRRLTRVLSFLSLVHCRGCMDADWGGAREYGGVPEALSDVAIGGWCPPPRGSSSLQVPQCRFLASAEDQGNSVSDVDT